MTINEFKNYAKSKLNLDLTEYLKPISDISKSDIGNISLIDSDEKIYAFDDIVKSLFNFGPCPASVDGLYFSESRNGNTLILIEFKTGFNQRITKETFDIGKCKCPHSDKTNQVNCEDYGKIFLENQNLKYVELLDSLKLKLAESYLMLEKLFFGNERTFTGFPIKMIVVIDANVLDTQEDDLAKLAKKTSGNDKIQSVKNALSRFSSNKYRLYQEIEVFSAIQFEKKCNAIDFIV